MTVSCVKDVAYPCIRPTTGGIFFAERNYFRGWRWIPDLKLVILISQCVSVSHYVVVSRTFWAPQGSAVPGLPFPEKSALWQRHSRLIADPSNPFEVQGTHVGACAPWITAAGFPAVHGWHRSVAVPTVVISPRRKSSPWPIIYAGVPSLCLNNGIMGAAECPGGGPCQEVACPPGWLYFFSGITTNDEDGFLMWAQKVRPPQKELTPVRASTPLPGN